MSDLSRPTGSEKTVVPLESLPKPVLQELYHAVTGKTENFSSVLRGNVIIAAADFDRLHDMLMDQLSLHQVVADPTVTVVVKHETSKSVRYSSWARFKALNVSDYEITSEIILRFEFLTQLPQTPRPQRCTVDVNLDSSLPVIRKHEDGLNEFDGVEGVDFGYFFMTDWRTAKISIDFVDFLVAKAFGGTVEEWFKTLQAVPTNKVDFFLFKNRMVIYSTLRQLGRLGMAAFLAAYVGFRSSTPDSLDRLTVGVAIGLTIWAFAQIFEWRASKGIVRRIGSNIIPTVILLTAADQREYSKVITQTNSAAGTVFRFASTIVMSLATNVLASYIYSSLSSK